MSPPRARTDCQRTALLQETFRPEPAVAEAIIVAPPVASRRLWFIVVRCPFCSISGVTSLHVHRARSLTENVRRAGCGRGIYSIASEAT